MLNVISGFASPYSGEMEHYHEVVSDKRGDSLSKKNLSAYLSVFQSPGMADFSNENIWVFVSGFIANAGLFIQRLRCEYRSQSELVARAYEKWEFSFLKNLEGVFVIYLYDRSREQLFIIRDRWGLQPFYYKAQFETRGRFRQLAFSTDLDFIRRSGFSVAADGTMLLHYLSEGNLANPVKLNAGFYTDMPVLLQGHYLVISPKLGKIQMRRWYNPGNIEFSADFSDESWLNEMHHRLLQTAHDMSIPIGSQILNCTKDVIPNAFIKKYFFPQDTLAQQLKDIKKETWINLRQNLQDLYQEPLPDCVASLVPDLAKVDLPNEGFLLNGIGAEFAGGWTEDNQQGLLSLYLKQGLFSFLREKKKVALELPEFHFPFSRYFRYYVPSFYKLFRTQHLYKKFRFSVYLNPDFVFQYFDQDAWTEANLETPEDFSFHCLLNGVLQQRMRLECKWASSHGMGSLLPMLDSSIVEFLMQLPLSMRLNNGHFGYLMNKLLTTEDISCLPKEGKNRLNPFVDSSNLDAEFKNITMASREKLVSKGILRRSVLNQPFNLEQTMKGKSMDWRYLSAASCL